MTAIPTLNHATPEDVEAAFYEAIESQNLDALMALWADEEDIVCAHPNGQRMCGHREIRESWQSVFSANRRLHIRVLRSVRWDSVVMAVHNVVEQVSIEGESGALVLCSTNTFTRGADGWRLLAHHASALQGEAAEALVSYERPKVLH